METGRWHGEHTVFDVFAVAGRREIGMIVIETFSLQKQILPCQRWRRRVDYLFELDPSPR